MNTRSARYQLTIEYMGKKRSTRWPSMARAEEYLMSLPGSPMDATIKLLGFCGKTPAIMLAEWHLFAGTWR